MTIDLSRRFCRESQQWAELGEKVDVAKGRKYYDYNELYANKAEASVDSTSAAKTVINHTPLAGYPSSSPRKKIEL
jgi:hypothetical protein